VERSAETPALVTLPLGYVLRNMYFIRPWEPECCNLSLSLTHTHTGWIRGSDSGDYVEYDLLACNPGYAGRSPPTSSGSKCKPSEKQAASTYVPPQRQCNSTGLHGVTSQKIVLNAHTMYLMLV
jgi:hypothetical protein